jgi:hypothetical protein
MPAADPAVCSARGRRYATEGGRARGWVGQEVQAEGAFGGPCRSGPPRPRLRPPGAPGPWRETRDMLWSAYLHLLNLRCGHRRGPPRASAGPMKAVRLGDQHSTIVKVDEIHGVQLIGDPVGSECGGWKRQEAGSPTPMTARRQPDRRAGRPRLRTRSAFSQPMGRVDKWAAKACGEHILHPPAGLVGGRDRLVTLPPASGRRQG